MIKTHSFDVGLAAKIGLNEAIITGYIAYWVYQNKLNDKNLFNGRFWTFNTSAALAKHFPYFTAGQIKNILLKLEKEGVLISDNFNKNQFDRTKWYSLSDEYLYLIDETIPENSDGLHEIDAPLPKSDAPLHENDNGLHENDAHINNKHISDTNTEVISEFEGEVAKAKPRTSQKTNEAVETEIINTSTSSFGLKRETGFASLSRDYITRLRIFIEGKRKECPYFMSADEFFNALCCKNYKYLNFAMAYMRWNAKNTNTPQRPNPHGLSQGALNTMENFKALAQDLRDNGQGEMVGDAI